MKHIYHGMRTQHFIMECNNKQDAEALMDNGCETYGTVLEFKETMKNVDRLHPEICQVCSDFKSKQKGEKQ